jgi:hypothetical protein
LHAAKTSQVNVVDDHGHRDSIDAAFAWSSELDGSVDQTIRHDVPLSV